jgi:hypothetical protein
MAKKLKPTDGLGALEIRRIRNALRNVWRYSLAHKLVRDRCRGKDGFHFCEKCRKRTPALKIDHIEPCGQIDSGFITRLFCSSEWLQGLCHDCHRQKTKAERLKDFY